MEEAKIGGGGERESDMPKEEVTRRRRLLVVGGGCAGLAAAYFVKTRASSAFSVEVWESDERLGGHANTITVQTPEGAVDVDTGFMVYNTVNYPHLIGLFEELGVSGQSTDMGFSVSMDQGRFEWCADSWAGLFATPSNLLSPAFYRMISDIFRFNKKAKETLLLPQNHPTLALTVGEWLALHGMSDAFATFYLVPMTAAIWSASSSGILNFPALALLSFLDNHLLLQTSRNLTWMTPQFRSADYVTKIRAALGEAACCTGRACAKVTRKGKGGGEAGEEKGCVLAEDGSGHASEFDEVIFACHPDTALRLVSSDPGATSVEKNILACFEYSSNDVYVHGDPTLMPRSKVAWASWNYLGHTPSTAGGAGPSPSLDKPVFVTYWLNRLQHLRCKADVFVSLNPHTAPKPELVHARLAYAHPQYSVQSVAAQRRVKEELQGRVAAPHTYYAGAWLGHGFHEDGVKSGLEAAARLTGVPVPVHWRVPGRQGGRVGNKGALSMAGGETNASVASRAYALLQRLAGPVLRLMHGLSEEALFFFLQKGFKKGRVHFACPGGRTRTLGQGIEGPDLAVLVRDSRFFSRVALEYDLGLCRSFIAGEWELPNLGADYEGLTQLFTMLIDNSYSVQRKQDRTLLSAADIAVTNLPTAWVGSLLSSLVYFLTMDNSVANSRSHIYAHYDLSNELFRTFLDDETMMYSSGLFRETFDARGHLVLTGSLAEAQERKIQALLSRLKLTKDCHLLDIGFGWGGIAIAAAATYGCRVHGITLSAEQKKLAEERVRARGLQHLVTFEMADYRVFARSGRTFDRIVSCEMIEAVGHKYLPSFFAAVDKLLALDGVFVMQAITMPDSRYPLYKVRRPRRPRPPSSLPSLTLVSLRPHPRAEIRRLLQHCHLPRGVLP